MKLLLILLLCWFAGEDCLSQPKEFYDEVLNDTGRNSLFVAIDVESSGYTGRIIVESGYLYHFLSETEGFDRERYREFMKNLLLKQGKLRLKNVSLDKDKFFLKIKGFSPDEFMVVKEDKNVEEIAAKGCEEFIRHYFDKIEDGLTLKPSIGTDERNAIVNKLFTWQVAVYISDITGSIVIKK